MTSVVNTAREGHVAVITLNRPDAMNAIDVDMRCNLLRVLDDIARQPDVRAVILTGAGKAFCSGADLKSAAANPDTSLRRTARTLLHDFQPIVECISRMDKPVIASVNGAAVGVGMSLALSCDLMIMSDSAYLLSPFVGIGLIPDSGLAWFLTRRIGYNRTFEILAESRKLSASFCVEIGIANRAVGAEALATSVLQWAAELSERAPIAIALTKRAARLAMSTGLSDALTMEAELQTLCASTEDAQEAIAAFREKRTPIFHGR